MIGTNIINNVLEVDLNEYLYAYRADQPLLRSDAEQARDFEGRVAAVAQR